MQPNSGNCTISFGQREFLNTVQIDKLCVKLHITLTNMSYVSVTLEKDQEKNVKTISKFNTFFRNFYAIDSLMIFELILCFERFYLNVHPPCLAAS